MQPDVSVLLPVYNAKDFLAETLQSILDQTHQNFELITIDDGSTDGSSDILTDFARRDNRIFFSRQENRGAGATANECMEKATSALVVRHDADDLMLPNRLERQIWFMRQNEELSASTSYAWLIDRYGNLIAEAKPKIDIERGIRESNPHWFVSLIQPATIMRKRDIEAVGGYRSDYRFGEDRELWGRLVVSGYRLAVQREFLIKQRLHGSSLTVSKLRDHVLICDCIDQNIIRSLHGQPYVSFETYLEGRKKGPFFKRLSRDVRELGLIHYKEATRDFADRQWWRFLKHSSSATVLNPAYGLRMFQKLSCKGGVERGGFAKS
jgi:glycosyltransferase involved in cell wall biosynthesis